MKSSFLFADPTPSPAGTFGSFLHRPASSSAPPPTGLAFLKEPDDTWASRTRPATLNCRVARASSVHFSCNSAVVAATSSKMHVEPETGVRYTEASVQIGKDEVERFAGDYYCQCVAVGEGGGQVVTSRHARVNYACE